MKNAFRMAILALAVLIARSLFAQTPTLHIWELVNSGKPNPAIDVTSESDIADLSSRLRDLPSATRPSGGVLGWNGFLLENRGVSSFPAQIQVLFGVIKIVQGPGSRPQYFQDTKGFSDRV